MFSVNDPQHTCKPKLGLLSTFFSTETEVPPQNLIMEDEMDMIDPEDPQPLSSNENTFMETKHVNENLDTTVRVLTPSTRKQMDLAVSSTNPEGVEPAKKTVYNKIKSNAFSTEVANFWDTKNTKIQTDTDNLERKTKAQLMQLVVDALIGTASWSLGFFGLMGFTVGLIFGFYDGFYDYSIEFKILCLIGSIMVVVYFMLCFYYWDKTIVQLSASIPMIICAIICFVFISCKYDWKNTNETFNFEKYPFKLVSKLPCYKAWQVTGILGIEYLIFGIFGLLSYVGAL